MFFFFRKKVTAAELWQRFFETKNFPRSSRWNHEAAKNNFIERFGNRSINSIKSAEIESWRDSLFAVRAPATIGGYLKNCGQVFRFAVKQGLLKKSPFVGVERPSAVNKAREFFITRESYEKLLESCPDQTWRTLLALCRIGGLRNPSETRILRWSDVNFDRGTIFVRSPKTAHRPGKESRMIPLYPELREELERQRAEYGTDSEVILFRWKTRYANHRKYFLKIIAAAGLEPWPRLFHNLRGSRSCELFSDFSAHVAAAWQGQSYRIALEHYLHPTEVDIKKATGDYKSE